MSISITEQTIEQIFTNDKGGWISTMRALYDASADEIKPKLAEISVSGLTRIAARADYFSDAYGRYGYLVRSLLTEKDEEIFKSNAGLLVSAIPSFMDLNSDRAYGFIRTLMDRSPEKRKQTMLDMSMHQLASCAKQNPDNTYEILEKMADFMCSGRSLGCATFIDGIISTNFARVPVSTFIADWFINNGDKPIVALRHRAPIHGGCEVVRGPGARSVISWVFNGKMKPENAVDSIKEMIPATVRQEKQVLAL